jgi:hypothetical protein
MLLLGSSYDAIINSLTKASDISDMLKPTVR